jgi:hypothetical protein
MESFGKCDLCPNEGVRKINGAVGCADHIEEAVRTIARPIRIIQGELGEPE